jgi:hypothetical protein
MTRREFILLALLATGLIVPIHAVRAWGGDAQEIVVVGATSLRDSNKEGRT